MGWRSAGAGGKLGGSGANVTERERPMSSLSDTFNKLAQWTAHHAGRPVAFAMAVGAIVIWVLSGPIFQWSDTWQLVINTGTTIVTFLMVFLIQNTQNRDTQALQLKIDELIRANEGARNRLLRLEEMSEEEMNHVREAFLQLAREDTSIIEERQERARRDTKRRGPVARHGLPERHGDRAIEAQPLGHHGGPKRQHGRPVDPDPVGRLAHARALSLLTGPLPCRAILPANRSEAIMASWRPRTVCRMRNMSPRCATLGEQLVAGRSQWC